MRICRNAAAKPWRQLTGGKEARRRTAGTHRYSHSATAFGARTVVGRSGIIQIDSAVGATAFKSNAQERFALRRIFGCFLSPLVGRVGQIQTRLGVVHDRDRRIDIVNGRWSSTERRPDGVSALLGTRLRTRGLFVFQLFQVLFQLASGAVQAASNGANGDAQNLRDLLIVMPLHLSQDQNGTMVFG